MTHQFPLLPFTPFRFPLLGHVTQQISLPVALARKCTSRDSTISSPPITLSSLLFPPSPDPNSQPPVVPSPSPRLPFFHSLSLLSLSLPPSSFHPRFFSQSHFFLRPGHVMHQFSFRNTDKLGFPFPERPLNDFQAIDPYYSQLHYGPAAVMNRRHCTIETIR